MLSNSFARLIISMAVPVTLMTGLAPYAVNAADTGAKPAPTQAQPAAEDREGDPLAIYADAGASAEQLTKIRDLAREWETNARVKSERIHKIMKELQTMSLTTDPDADKAVANQNEINSLMSEMSISKLKLMLKIRTLLSAEQKTKLVELLKARNPSL
jgi:Spy/CpxP family protein refolding chaperone